jgi:1-acyl-sn-glycerol-3-phosphate acyltransferase
MSLGVQVVNTVVKGVTRMICRIDEEQLAKIPRQGPLILVCNHINFIEVPLVYTHLLPRPVIGYAKAESWDNPALGWLFDLWEGIPLHRGEADTSAVRKGLQVLAENKILVITPEGTRTGDGRLRRGFPGMVLLAMRSNAPFLPMVYYGHEDYRENLKRLQRSEFHFVVGKQFRLKIPAGNTKSTVRQIMTDEIMYQLAALLPESYRGEYADPSKATTQYLDFD